MKLCLLFYVLFSIQMTFAAGKTSESLRITDFLKRPDAIYFQKSGTDVIRYFSTDYQLKFADPIGRLLSFSVYTGKPNRNSALTTFPHWENKRFRPYQLEARSDCELKLQVENIERAISKSDSEGNSISGENGYLCRFDVYLRLHPDMETTIAKVRTALEEAGKNGSLLKPIFHAAFQKKSPIYTTDSRALIHEVRQLTPDDPADPIDRAFSYFLLGAALGEQLDKSPIQRERSDHESWKNLDLNEQTSHINQLHNVLFSITSDDALLRNQALKDSVSVTELWTYDEEF